MLRDWLAGTNSAASGAPVPPLVRERPAARRTVVNENELPPTGAPAGGPGAARVDAKSPIMSELAP